MSNNKIPEITDIVFAEPFTQEQLQEMFSEKINYSYQSFEDDDYYHQILPSDTSDYHCVNYNKKGEFQLITNISYSDLNNVVNKGLWKPCTKKIQEKGFGFEQTEWEYYFKEKIGYAIIKIPVLIPINVKIVKDGIEYIIKNYQENDEGLIGIYAEPVLK